MLDYAFLEILETLSKEELKAFRRFILSPYFNRSGKVVKLFDRIAKYHPHFESPNLTKEKLHQKISQELPYNEITMRRLLFDLQTLTEKFVKQINFEKKSIESRTFMTEEIGARGAGKMFYKNVKTTSKMLDELGYISGDVYLNKFRLETDQFYFGMINDKINKKSFVNIEAGRLIRGITYLISYSMLETIKHNYTLLTYSRSFNVKHNEKVISEFINLFDFERLTMFMKKYSSIRNYIVEVYLNALKSYLYFDNDSYYKEFKNSLLTHRKQLSPSDNHFLFAKLSGYSVLKIYKNSRIISYFDNDLFDIHKIILEEKYYETETNKYLPLDLFRNVLMQSIKLKELGWLEDFIFTYGQKLHPNKKSDVMNYGYALLYFERNAYNESLGYLSRIKMDEFIYNLDIRNLYLRIYFEQEDYDTALSFAKSYLKFINENQLVSEAKKTGHENFVKYTIKLLNYFNINSKTDLSSLYLQISKCKNIVNGDWLMNKVKSLEKSIRRAG